ncbi:MAG: DUF2335 domain-containing protein [Deltaproteobacteria bacterium]|nr:DUF2335 domain-containing protein [Deltaproteobacteria bacterium]
MSKPTTSKSPNFPARREGHTAIAEIKQSSFSSPIPPPAILEEYDRVIPGAAERILKMAEADVQYQRDITFAALNSEVAEKKRGQVLGFLIGNLALVVTGAALYLGYPDVASILGGTTLVGLVSVFAIGRFLERPQGHNDS